MAAGIGFESDRFGPLDPLRARAWERWLALGVPTLKDEEWKYTDLRPFRLEGAREVAPVSMRESHVADHWWEEMDCLRMVFVDGRWDIDLTSPLKTDGLEIRSFPCAVDNVPDEMAARVGTLARMEEERFEVSAHLGQLRKDPAHALAALNTATFRDGAYVRVARNVKIEKPIHVVHIAAGEGYVAPRIFLELEEGAEATLIETYLSAGDVEGITNVVAEIHVGRNAKLSHVRVQNESVVRGHVALTEARQEADSTYLHYNIGFGAKTARNDVNVFLAGDNLHCRLDGVVAIDGDQHHDNHTRLDHAKPHCDSFEVYKHVLDDRSTAVFNGKIFVHQDAQKTDAKQTNQTLLLSPAATINTKPQLEIFADDVKCTHGATIGQVRDDALFYLRARGVPLAEARALLVYAFAAEVIEKIENEPLRLVLERMLYEKLGTA
jgi:Fe-S cluster assembly protein SufD